LILRAAKGHYLFCFFLKKKRRGDMTKVEPITNESVQSGSEVLREQLLSPTPIDHLLQRLSRIELPAKEHFEGFLR